ncbi:MAG: hypothetical protein RLZZ350_444 [Verrucomicrobiota bacterium]|jgi:hypothetical protein
MKFNKWTLGLAALGVVSLATAVKADNTAPAMIETAVSGTTISGYVNTSAHWNVGDNGVFAGSTLPGYSFNNRDNSTPLANTKSDGFNLDAIKIGISKAMDESEWASGYNVELVNGLDGRSLNSNVGGINTAGIGGFGIKQAYVSLRTPIGNGIDWKIGVFDTIIGYEVFDAGGNANYTRSYGYSVEPTTHEGVLASYKFADWISAQAGIANTTGYTSLVPNRSAQGESHKTYMGSVALTAPQSWGVLAGSQLYGGVITGTAALSAAQTVNYYAGAVVNTGVKGLKLGASYDYAGQDSHVATSGAFAGAATRTWSDAVAVYASFQATEKLSLHARAEYAWQDTASVGAGSSLGLGVASVYAVTGTVQYDLWKNVMSRLEIRWDRSNSHTYGQAADLKRDNVLLAANVIYKF